MWKIKKSNSDQRLQSSVGQLGSQLGRQVDDEEEMEDDEEEDSEELNEEEREDDAETFSKQQQKKKTASLEKLIPTLPLVQSSLH